MNRDATYGAILVDPDKSIYEALKAALWKPKRDTVFMISPAQSAFEQTHSPAPDETPALSPARQKNQ